MKKILVLLALLIVYSMTVSGQGNQQDVIYLNNGQVIKGQITEMSPNESVEIRSENGTVYTYRMVEVRKISRGDVIMPTEVNTPRYRDNVEYEKGYWLAGELAGGSTAYFKGDNIGYSQLTVINGYRFSEFLRVGIGAGFRYYINNDNRRFKSNPWSFPVYLDVRGNIISQRVDRVAPYWSLDAGVAICDGFFVSPTIGIRFGGNRSNFLLGLSYLAQDVKYYTDSNKMIHLVSLKLGYEF